MVKRGFAVFVLACLGLSASPALAQSTPTPAATEGWRVRIVPYVWGSSFRGRVGIGDRSVDVDASFWDILRNLNFAFMGVVEVGQDKFVTVTNLEYLSLSDERATPGPLFSRVDPAEKLFIFSPLAGYRVVGSEA